MSNRVMIFACTMAIGVALVQSNRVAAQDEKPSAQVALAKSIGEISTEALGTRDQLQAAVGTLNALTNQKQGDLKPAYDDYVAEVGRTHNAAEKTASRAAAMQRASQEYFGGWQKEIDSISNESLRRRGQKRLDSVRNSYDKVIGSLQEASKRFKPLLSDLDDVQKMLANDITSGGVKSVRGVARNAGHNVDKVRESINRGITELQRMESALSSKSSN